MNTCSFANFGRRQIFREGSTGEDSAPLTIKQGVQNRDGSSADTAEESLQSTEDKSAPDLEAADSNSAGHTSIDQSGQG